MVQKGHKTPPISFQVNFLLTHLNYNGLVKLNTKFAEMRETDRMKIYD